MGLDAQQLEAALAQLPAALNAEQRLAIERMLCGSHGRQEALLVFGPPGTGKTLTLVEGMLSALAHHGAGYRILCCAPSDSAADVIVQRLISRAKDFHPPPPAFAPWQASGVPPAVGEGECGSGDGEGGAESRSGFLPLGLGEWERGAEQRRGGDANAAPRAAAAESEPAPLPEPEAAPQERKEQPVLEKGEGSMLNVEELSQKAPFGAGTPVAQTCIAATKASGDLARQNAPAAQRVGLGGWVRGGALAETTRVGGRAAAEGASCSWVTRLNSCLRDIQTVRPDVVPYSTALDPESQRFVVPERRELLAVPILVTTCASAMLLGERGISPGHFDMIVIDEAAQALEPETLVPLTLKGPATRVVLAGGS